MALKAVATPQAREAARRVCMAQADARAIALAPVIAEIRANGITGPYAIAAALTVRGIPTARGHRLWMASQVRSILIRLDRLSAGPAQKEWLGSAQPASVTLASEQRENHP